MSKETGAKKREKQSIKDWVRSEEGQKALEEAEKDITEVEKQFQPDAIVNEHLHHLFVNENS